mmetsp:Transcript_123592/g.357438  ORF Transcript_123592/g.357438 Transcript_123592/m.357438 type:complete len:623 (+) Transcript_123592:121-1989(+)
MVHTAAVVLGSVLAGALLVAAKEVAVPSQVNPAWRWGRVSVHGVGPSVREGQQAVEVGDNIYIFGGCVQETRCYNDVWILNTQRMEWRQDRFTGAFPEPRGGHTATLVSTSVFVFGGANSQDTFGDVFRLDLENKQWSTGVVSQPELSPGRRTNHAAAADADGRVYVFGGYDFRGVFLGDFWVLQAPSLQHNPWKTDEVFAAVWVSPATTGKAPTPREGHSMTVIGRGMFVFGGFSNKGEILNDLFLYDLDQLVWRELRPAGALPPPRQAHAGVRHGQELVISGGCDISADKPRCFSDVWTLHPMEMRWRERSSAATTWLPREGHSVAFARGKMIAFGGCMLGSECYSDVAALDTFDPCPNRCGGNGECVEGAGGLFCRCTRSGFGGHDCMQPMSCRSDCGPHGRCSQEARCTCDNGWSGEDCSREAICPGADTKCNGHGICQPSGACHCLSGFSGPDCGARTGAFLQERFNVSTGLVDLRGEVGSLYTSFVSGLRAVRKHDGSQPPLAAGGGAGSIAATAHSSSSASSATGWNEGNYGGSGKSCSVNCMNHGVCQDGVCFCQPGFYGVSCSTVLAAEENTIGLGQALGIAGVAMLASAVVTCIASKWGHSKSPGFALDRRF